MYLKEYEVPIPYDKGKIVIRNEQYVLLETERKYSGETKNTRVKRIMIGKVVPLFGGMMYPNEHYFELIPNDVPTEIRDPFLARCERKHEIAELKKDPERMMQTVVKGIQFLQNTGRKIKMENKEEQKEEQFWFITNAHDLEYVMKVFGDLYNLMEVYTTRNPNHILAAYKVEMFNKILEELKLTMPEHRILQQLELIRGPGEESEEPGMTNSDVLMLLTFYKNCLKG